MSYRANCGNATDCKKGCLAWRNGTDCEKVNSKPNNMNKTVSIVVSVILGIVTVGTVFMSPEFLESDYVSPSGAFWLKWGLTALGALGTYLSGNNAAKQ